MKARTHSSPPRRSSPTTAPRPTTSSLSETTGVSRLLDQARARLRRLDPVAAAQALAAGAVLVDVRTSEQRAADGQIPGAVGVSLDVLEWRADPLVPSHDPRLGDSDVPLVVLCNEGYSSSLAAARLLDIGRDATDVVGGFQAWRAAGLPVTPPATLVAIGRKTHALVLAPESNHPRACRPTAPAS